MKKDFIFSPIDNLKGVGPQLSKYLKKKRIEKVKDVILNLPYSETDRSKIYKLKDLEIGRIQTVKIQVKKLNFPRIRNLPNRITCVDDTGKIEIVYFNSREGYLRKLFPLNKFVVVSGKINYFNKKYQITNPDYVTSLEDQEYVVKNIPKYNLTKGINEKKYRNISEQVINNLPKIDDWLNENFIKEIHSKYHKKALNILKELSPNKIPLYDYSEFHIIETGSKSKFPIHDDTPDKLLSGVVYLKPTINNGTTFYDTKNGKGKRTVDWKVNRAVFFSRIERKTWHSYAGDERNNRIVLVYNLMTKNIKEVYKAENKNFLLGFIRFKLNPLLYRFFKITL